MRKKLELKKQVMENGEDKVEDKVDEHLATTQNRKENYTANTRKNEDA